MPNAGAEISSSWLVWCCVMTWPVEHLANRKFFHRLWFLYDTSFWRQVMLSYTTVAQSRKSSLFVFFSFFLQEEKNSPTETNQIQKLLSRENCRELQSLLRWAIPLVRICISPLGRDMWWSETGHRDSSVGASLWTQSSPSSGTGPSSSAWGTCTSTTAPQTAHLWS